jgi:hypothetical protein
MADCAHPMGPMLDADLAARDLAEHFEQVRAPGGARSHTGVLLTT